MVMCGHSMCGVCVCVCVYVHVYDVCVVCVWWRCMLMWVCVGGEGRMRWE